MLGGHKIQRCGIMIGGGMIATAPVVLDEVETGNTVPDSVVVGVPDSSGSIPVITGPSMGRVGRIAIGQAELSVAGGNTSDNGRKLSSPSSQQGPKSC